MRLFYDKAQKQEITGTIDFGKVEAGKNKTIEVYLHNDSPALFQGILVKAEGGEDIGFRVVSHPSVLEAGKMGVITLKWSPDHDLRKGLKTKISVIGEELYTA